MKTKSYQGITIRGYSNLNFQRNGVAGESFYSVVLTTKEKNRNENFLVTFQTDESDIRILKSSCRVVNLSKLTDDWRGDDFANSMNDMFNNLRAGFHLGTMTIYDFLEMERNYNKVA